VQEVNLRPRVARTVLNRVPRFTAEAPRRAMGTVMERSDSRLERKDSNRDQRRCLSYSTDQQVGSLRASHNLYRHVRGLSVAYDSHLRFASFA
jgi:hypothetical protein